MRLFQNLKRTIDLLKPWEGYYAMCGGIAASLYHDTPRYTGNIDIALINAPHRAAIRARQEGGEIRRSAACWGAKPFHIVSGLLCKHSENVR